MRTLQDLICNWKKVLILLKGVVSNFLKKLSLLTIYLLIKMLREMQIWLILWLSNPTSIRQASLCHLCKTNKWKIIKCEPAKHKPRLSQDRESNLNYVCRYIKTGKVECLTWYIVRYRERNNWSIISLIVYKDYLDK